MKSDWFGISVGVLAVLFFIVILDKPIRLLLDALKIDEMAFRYHVRKVVLQNLLHLFSGTKAVLVWYAVMLTWGKYFPETFLTFYHEDKLYWGLPIILFISTPVLLRPQPIPVIGGVIIFGLWCGYFYKTMVATEKWAIIVEQHALSTPIEINAYTSWTTDTCIFVHYNNEHHKECPGEPGKHIQVKSVRFTSASSQKATIVFSREK